MQLQATATHPVTVYYCKAGVKTGLTVRVLHCGVLHERSGVALRDAVASMMHNNSTGRPKSSGARCVLHITGGSVDLL